jgi:oxygen-dependent protoporphyrinogen oxidase
MAQYSVGHQTRIGAIKDRLTENPGLFLVGNAYHGIGIPDCIRMGKQLAESVLK